MVSSDYFAKAAAAQERRLAAGGTLGKNSQAEQLLRQGFDMPRTAAALGVDNMPIVNPLRTLPTINPMTSVAPGSVPGGAGTAMIPAALGLLGGVGGTVGTIAGIAGAGYGVLQALGLGEGGGLFGNNLLGGDTSYLSGIPLGGPGLAEPPAEWIEKEWHVSYDWGDLQYYLVRMPTGGRKIALYNTRTKRWKAWAWRSPRLAVIGKNMPSHKMITRLRRNLKKHSADARTILKMTSPSSLEQHKRRRR